MRAIIVGDFLDGVFVVYSSGSSDIYLYLYLFISIYLYLSLCLADAIRRASCNYCMPACVDISYNTFASANPYDMRPTTFNLQPI